MKKTIILALSVMFMLTANAQDWVEGMSDPSVNFYTVQNQFNTYVEKAKKQAIRKNKDLEEGEFGYIPGYMQYKRWEAFWHPRVYPNGVRPSTNMLEESLFFTSNKTTSSSSNTGAWQALGPFDAPNPANSPYPGIGRINCITFDPNNSNIIWVGTPSGGLWKSTDGGVNWSTNTDQLPNLGISAIAIDPLHPDTMFIATGDRDGGQGDTYSYGVLKSTDGGATWNTTGRSFNLGSSVKAGGLYINPLNTQIVVVATRSGIFRTTDGGTTWPGIQTGPFNMLATDPNNPNIIFAGTYGSNTAEIWRSTDFGASWTKLTNGLPSSNSNRRVEIAVSPVDSNYIYAVYCNNGNGFGGLYQSIDGGNTWSQKSSTPNILSGNSNGTGTGGQGWYDLAITLSPTNKNQVFVGGVHIWRSNNQGTSWTCVANGYPYQNTSIPYVHPDIHYLKFQPGTNTLYVGSDGGVFKTEATSTIASWTPLYYNMNITQYYKISQSRTNSTLIMGGAQDNGTHLKTGTFWDFINGGDGMDNAIDPDNNMIMYASSQNGNFSKSVNGGQSFFSMQGLPNNSGAWVTPIQIDPSNSSIVYIGLSRLYKSTNKGANWSPTSTQNVGAAFIECIGVAPSNGQVIYVSIGSSLFKSTNSGSSWSPLSTAPGIRDITGITISPTDENHIWITRSGYDQGEKVYESGNGGMSWGNRSAGLPNLPANCIIYENGSLDGVYVGTDVGVYYRDATMTEFVPFFQGLPNVIVDDLEIYYAPAGGSRIRAGTYGRGLWESPLFRSFAKAPVANFSASPASVCTTSDIITLSDDSELSPNSWQWSVYPNTFAYVNGTTDTSQNPQVTFTAKGQYSITLTVSNNYGSDTKTIAKVISVGGQPLPFTEDFENPAFVEQWEIENPDNNKTWEIAMVGGSQPGNQAISMNFFNYNAIGQKDGLISPPLSFVGFNAISLTFDHAYVKYNAAKNDSLKVYISTDCGSTWALLQAFGEDITPTNTWVTGPNSTSVFVPGTAANWCNGSGNATCKTINLNSYAGNDEVKIKFVGKNAYGNNLYLDNINITGTPNLKPIADFIGDTTGCTIGSVGFYDVSANNATSWNWSMPGATPATSNQPNPQVTYAAGGNYTVTLIAGNAAGADTITRTAFVSVNQALVPTIAIASSNSTICAQDMLTLTATVANSGSNPNYFWYRNGNFETKAGPVINLTDAANGDVFSCVLRPSSTCVTSDSVMSNSVTVNVLPLPAVMLNNTFAAMCLSENPITLSGGTPAGGVYSGTGVSNGSFDPQIAGVGGHVITYTYVDPQTNCSNFDIKNITVNNAPPKPTVSYSNLILKVSPKSPSYSYQWIDGQGNPIAGATDTIYIPWVVGDYAVQIGLLNNCTNRSTYYTVNQVGLNEYTLENGIALYPNPVRSELTVQFVLSAKADVVVSVLDITGRTLKQVKSTHENGNISLQIDVNDLPAGAYFVKVNDGRQSTQRKFVKQ